jgi:hypothetical protein
LSLLKAAFTLHRLGKAAILDTLLEFSEVAPGRAAALYPQHCTLLALLFEVDPSAPEPNPSASDLEPKFGRIPVKCMVVEGLPLVWYRGGMRAGHSPSIGDHVEFYRKHARLKNTISAPENPLNIPDRVARTEHWSKDSPELTRLRGAVRLLLRTVHPVTVVDFDRTTLKPVEWRRFVTALERRPFAWSSTALEFRLAKGPRAPEFKLVPVERIVWVPKTAPTHDYRVTVDRTFEGTTNVWQRWETGPARWTWQTEQLSPTQLMLDPPENGARFSPGEATAGMTTILGGGFEPKAQVIRMRLEWNTIEVTSPPFKLSAARR